MRMPALLQMLHAGHYRLAPFPRAGMTIISSHRRHADDAVYATHQINALLSWEAVADTIVYFGQTEPELAGAKTKFIPSPGWPRIIDLARYAYECGPVSAIVNSDIVLRPAIIGVFDTVRRSGVSGATSRRYELETGLLNPEDRGRDIFVCKRRVWGMVAHEIPECMRIGHQQWDSWMVGFLRKKLGTKFADFTQAQAVFHPQHEGRNMPYSGEIQGGGPYIGYWNGTQDTQIV